MSRTTTKSIFALAIKALLDETNLFNRREWAEFLGVSEPAISQWVGDKTIPRPDLLYMMVDVLEHSTDVPEAPLKAFQAMAQQAATEVSPHGKRMLPTVWAYMTRPAFSELSSTLAKLSPEEQAKLLFEKHKKGELTGEAADRVPEKHHVVVAVGATAKVAPRVAEMAPEPVVTSPVVPCARAEDAMSCAEWEPASWKGIMAPRFRLLGEAGVRGVEEQTHEWGHVSQHPHVLLVGAPGTGKTNFLLHLARSAWAQREGVGVSLFYFHLGCLSRIQTADELEEVHRRLVPSDTDPSRTTFLLDGFDEVRPENRNRLAGAISGFQSRNPEARLVVSSRPSPDLSAFAKMTWCEMEAPPPDRLIAWVQQELSEKLALGGGWDKAMQTFVLSLKERPDVFGELQNPLLLSHCTQLFVRHSLTANHDVDMFQECLRLLLDDWDEKKNIVRRAAAGSWASPRHLYQWLSGLCYHALTEQRREFTSDEVEAWSRKYGSSAPVEEILRVLSEATGIVQPSRGGRWIIVHSTFQEYLAARYIVDSSNDATFLVKKWLHAPWMSNVLKFACAATNDASPLLHFALTADWPRPDDNRMATLADMIAQQLTADTDLIKRSCDELTGWLDSSFTGWETTTVDDGDQISPPKWRLAARKTGRNRTPESPSLLRTLRAVHRARLSPAKSELSERLKVSHSDIVRAVGESLDVDGYLKAQMVPQNGNSVLVAEVLAA